MWFSDGTLLTEQAAWIVGWGFSCCELFKRARARTRILEIIFVTDRSSVA
jgi:hypothetical protein